MVLDITFSVAIAVLAVAMVVLFAMLGELAAIVKRIPSTPNSGPLLRPIENAAIGRSPRAFPDGPLSRVAESEFAQLVVLSTSCKTCEDMAPAIRAELQADPKGDVVLVVSSPNNHVGLDFTNRHRLDAVPHWIDGGGKWLREEVGIDVSPAYLLFSGGSLRSAMTFSSVAALTQVVRSNAGEKAASQV